MSKELEIYRLERTVINQAHKLTDLRDRNLTWINNCQVVEKRYQAEKDRADRYGGLIMAIGQVLSDDELAYEEQVDTIDELVNQWKKQEEL